MREPRFHAVPCQNIKCRRMTRNDEAICDACLRRAFSAAGVRPPSHCSTPAAELLGQSSGPPVPRAAPDRPH